MTQTINISTQLASVSDIAERIDDDEYIEQVRQMILRTHTHPDNSKVELKLVSDPRGAEKEQIFAQQQQRLVTERLREQQKIILSEERRRATPRLNAASATKKYDGKETLIPNSKIIFTCNCGKSFALGSHDDHPSDSLWKFSYDESKDSKFSKINEYGLLVDAPSLEQTMSADYSSERPKENFSTGYDKNDDRHATPY